ncbi:MULTISPECIES: sugar phosphate isomerase/epimerase family protein [Bacillaceae]|uniref:sugar phosphate isomerase/epimerase family protein n=1 Tax=Bacillaceae TaxID=186817 RepID=UPI00288A55EE|nr:MULTISPECIES: sugar phosphate isomerase/epimerase [Bacillaceae]
MMNLGIRAHDLSSHSLEGLAKEASAKGFSAVQLALAKSFPDLHIQRGSLSSGLGSHISRAFSQSGIQIAVLGCYINMIHPLHEIRHQELTRFKEHLRYARDFGCSIVGTETGNVNEVIEYTEENFTEEAFQKVAVSVKELVAEAEKFGVIVGIEGGINHPIHTPNCMRRLLDIIYSNNLQVIYDPVNFITLDNYKTQEKLFQESIELFGDQIAIVHLKDFMIEDGKITTVPVGKGMLDYEKLFSVLKKNKPYMYYLMESTADPHIEESAKFIRNVYNSIN